MEKLKQYFFSLFLFVMCMQELATKLSRSFDMKEESNMLGDKGVRRHQVCIFLLVGVCVRTNKYGKIFIFYLYLFIFFLISHGYFKSKLILFVQKSHKI